LWTAAAQDAVFHTRSCVSGSKGVSREYERLRSRSSQRCSAGRETGPERVAGGLAPPSEDDHPWFEAGEDAPQGAVVVMLLRRIAHNFLALFRSLTQRSDEKRQTPWKDEPRLQPARVGAGIDRRRAVHQNFHVPRTPRLTM
jgi:hypothetical protein